MAPAIHQFVPTFARRDAIGAHVRQVQRVLREMGIVSDIYAEGAPGTGWRQARPYRTYPGPGSQPTWLLYHLSTGSAVADFVLARPEPKLVYFHNITPPELFAPWELDAGRELEWGRRQLRQLAPVTDLALAASRFSEAELQAAGYQQTAVAPVLVDAGGPEAARPSGRAAARLRRAKRAGGCDWLFVGRVAPNKCQHHLVGAFAAYRRLYDPRARLHLVGPTNVPKYTQALTDYIAALGLDDAVALTGSVDNGELDAYYEAADVFVCLSEHEGFCVPVIEAMRRRVPVVAYAAAAVPETVDDGGLVLAGKDPVTVAAAVNRVLSDTALAQSLRAAGQRRADELTLERAAAAFRQALSPLITGEGRR